MTDIGRPPGEPPEEVETEWRQDDEGHCASCGHDVTPTLTINIVEWLREMGILSDYTGECPHCGCEQIVRYSVKVTVVGYETQIFITPEDPNDAYDYLADR